MKRLVVKVGSAVLTENDGVALERMRNLVDFIYELSSRYEVILVSSGAVAAGYTKLQIDRSELHNKQALASIGQPLLMELYNRKFSKYNIVCSQVLVTAANFQSQIEAQRIKNTVDTLLENRVVPIVNENDVTATAELVLGDNDQLSAYTANAVGAELLLILSDIDAYYDHDPRSHSDAKILKVVSSITAEELSKEVSPNTTFATGGIVTKLKAANYLLEHDGAMFLSSGFDLSDAKAYLLDGIHKGGTLFSKKAFY
ncbi:MAG: glutamate 5-kinase [Sulfurimonadaceae bacterium]